MKWLRLATYLTEMRTKWGLKYHDDEVEMEVEAQRMYQGNLASMEIDS